MFNAGLMLENMEDLFDVDEHETMSLCCCRCCYMEKIPTATTVSKQQGQPSNGMGSTTTSSGKPVDYGTIDRTSTSDQQGFLGLVTPPNKGPIGASSMNSNRKAAGSSTRSNVHTTTGFGSHSNLSLLNSAAGVSTTSGNSSNNSTSSSSVNTSNNNPNGMSMSVFSPGGLINVLTSIRFMGFKSIPDDKLLQNILQRQNHNGAGGILGHSGSNPSTSITATFIEPSSLHKYSHNMRELQFEYFENPSDLTMPSSLLFDGSGHYNMNLAVDQGSYHHHPLGLSSNSSNQHRSVLLQSFNLGGHTAGHNSNAIANTSIAGTSTQQPGSYYQHSSSSYNSNNNNNKNNSSNKNTFRFAFP